MNELILATHRIDRESPPIHPIADDAWTAEAIAACLPPRTPAETPPPGHPTRRRASAPGGRAMLGG